VANSVQSLRRLVDAIVANDSALFTKLLGESPELATGSFPQGATRQHASPNFIQEIGHYIYSGDTALHFAAASYRHRMAAKLIEAGANVRARNRRRPRATDPDSDWAHCQCCRSLPIVTDDIPLSSLAERSA